MNKVTLIGNLTKAIEVKYTTSGTAIAKTAIACNKTYTDSKGNKKQTVMFIDVVAFGRTAEVINQYCDKGSKIAVDGELSFEQWTAQDGSKRSRHVVHINSMELLGSKPKEETEEAE